MADQKKIAKVLDRAAARASNPASSKQTWFLAGLWAKANNEVDYEDFLLDSSAQLSKADASFHIELALKGA
jgi:hypothetical protein